jgi:hypothetical protein
MLSITDGLASHHVAYKKGWTLKKETRTEHVRHIKLRDDIHKNQLEHMNGEIQDKEKTMKKLKTNDTPIACCQVFHNYIRPPEALDDKTS